MKIPASFALFFVIFFGYIANSTGQDAETYLQNGKRTWYSQQYDSAQYFFQSAFAQNSGEAAYFLGKLYYNGKENINADKTLSKVFFEKAVALGFEMAYMPLGMLALERNDNKTAEANFTKALPTIEKFAKENNKEAMQLLALMYQEGWKVSQSFTEAEKWAERAFNAGNTDVYTTFPSLLATLEKYASAEKYYKEALALLIPESKQFGEALLGLAQVYYSVGRFAEAENTYKQAIAFFRTQVGSNSEKYAQSLFGLADLYLDLGEYREMEKLYKYYLLALEERDLGKKSSDYANILYGLADLYIILKDYEKAENFYQQAQEIYKKNEGKNSTNYINTAQRLGDFYAITKNYQKSDEYYKKALKLTEKQGITCEVCYWRMRLHQARLYHKINKTKEALLILQEILANTEKTFGKKHPLYAETAYALTEVYLQEKKGVQAQENFEKSLASAIEYINEQFPILNDREKSFLYTSTKQNFELFNSFALFYYPESKHLLGDIYNYQLFTKALFLNLTNRVRDRILNSNNKNLVETYYQWKLQRDDLVYFASLTEEQRQTLGVDLEALTNQNNEIEKYLALESEAFKQANEQETVVWQDIQRSLKPNEAAIEIIRFRKASFEQRSMQDSVIIYAALILTPETTENPEIVLLQDGSLLESRYFSYYRNVILHRKEDKYSYEKFWQPIASKLPPQTKRVYFAPDGVYNQINLNVLKNPITGQYVIDEVDIRLLNNTREILNEKNKTSSLIGLPFFPSSGILIGRPIFNIDEKQKQEKDSLKADTVLQTFDDVFKSLAKAAWADLIGTELEVEGIAALLNQRNWRVATYLGEEATESQVKAVQNPTLLHIATHGFFVDNVTNANENSFGVDYEQRLLRQSGTAEAMLRSGVVLAGVTNYYQGLETNTSNDDGILTAYEVMNLNLYNTELVVLSACETGVGEVQTGEGVYGLQRALKIAGAKTIMMSLWKVDDSATQELMQIFYEEWSKSGDKREAFRIAQKRMRKQYENPYYWGAFIMVGE